MEPTKEDIEFLNMIDGGYIGFDKPKVQTVKEEGITIPPWAVKPEDGDYLPSDAQGWDK